MDPPVNQELNKLSRQRTGLVRRHAEEADQDAQIARVNLTIAVEVGRNGTRCVGMDLPGTTDVIKVSTTGIFGVELARLSKHGVLIYQTIGSATVTGRNEHESGTIDSFQNSCMSAVRKKSVRDVLTYCLTL